MHVNFQSALLQRTISIIISMVGGLNIARTISHGPNISPDSITYLNAAASFRAGMGFLQSGGDSPMTVFPPLYSALLAYVSPSVLAAASFAATVYLAGVLLRNAGLRSRCYYPAMLAVAFSAMLLWVYSYVWSETIFIPLALAALALLHRAENLRTLIAAAVFTALALLTRYAGFALLGTGIVVVWWTYRSNRVQAILRAALYSAISVAPVGLWMLRNVMAGDGAMGPRQSPIYGVQWALATMLVTILCWVPFMLGGALAIAICMRLGDVWRRQKSS